MAGALSTSPTTSHPRPRKGLHIALWSAQVVLAAVFAMAGLLKTTMPIPELAKQLSFVPVVGAGVTRFIGVAELTGAVGLLLPALTRIRPILTPLAATGLLLVMVLAAGFHLLHAEPQYLPITAVLGGMAAFIAWGRLRWAPIAPRTGTFETNVNIGPTTPRA